MTYKTWTCSKCGVEVSEDDYDYECHCFHISKNGKPIQVVYPDSIESMNELRTQLDNGSCPVCDQWEDGCGNTIDYMLTSVCN